MRCFRIVMPLVLFFVALTTALHAEDEAKTWGEKLGFPAGKRVLILHADDIGMCYEANEAAKQYLPKGDIQSAAMMVPCPWFNEIANWYKENPDYCMGLHLAMNAEWKWYRWPSVAPREEVPSMIDPDGYLWNDTLKTAMKSSAADIEKEIRAQIERALSRGIKPSHIDTHMGTLYARPDFTAAYLKVAEEYRIPAMVLEPSQHVIEKFRQRGIPNTEQLRTLLQNYKLPKLDDFDAVAEGKTYEAKRDAFFAQVKGLRPGITELIFHPSVLTEGLKQITGTWQQRAWEAEMFSDPVVKQFLESEGIIFTNWKDMMKRFDERFPQEKKEEEKKAAQISTGFYLAEDKAAEGLQETRTATGTIYLHEKPVLAVADVATAKVAEGANKDAIVDIRLTEAGAKKMRMATSKNLGKKLAIVVNHKVVIAPKIMSEISSQTQITGNFTQEEAEQIAEAMQP